jgi:hypothetical protein
MRPVRRLIFLAIGSSVLLIAGSLVFGMADRPAIVITPEGSPVWLDPQRSLFFDTPSVWVMWRNEYGEAINYAVRIWVFDERSRLKGTLDYCTYDQLGSHTRGRTLIPLGIPGVTLRDRAVVTISSAASGRLVWRLRETESEQLDAALAAFRGSARPLSLERKESGATEWTCPCDCTVIETACDRRCASTGRGASACTRTFDAGCSASCTCR